MSLTRKDFGSIITETRKELLVGREMFEKQKAAEEGGCGVVGFAASVPVRGKHIFEPSMQMHNRGNGKGGGIAAAGMVPEQLGVDEKTLNEAYLLQIALLDPKAEGDVEKQFVTPFFNVAHKANLAPKHDHRDCGLDTRPPDIVRYFVRVKDDVLQKFAKENRLEGMAPRAIEDEFVYRNTYNLNKTFYAALGDKKAFVLSHARNLMIVKIVGYAEQAVQYYGMEDFKAMVWIAHQRYPTKGRVWHPGGAHPFIGMNEALVHNGDFANYYAVTEYLKQHNLLPLFLTDTEVSVLMFDLLYRTYGYPLEYVIEALAPTTELDFDKLSAERQKLYRAVQAMHVRASPDGPWFFIIARSEPEKKLFQLMGITDTSMLRPQVFALQEGDVTIGLVASEKQAIDATLQSLHEDDNRFRPVADKYWNARGGSHTDGGAFVFNVNTDGGKAKLTCVDKFGREIKAPTGAIAVQGKAEEAPSDAAKLTKSLDDAEKNSDAQAAFSAVVSAIGSWNPENVKWIVGEIVKRGMVDSSREWSLQTLTLLNDVRYSCGSIKRSAVLEVVRAGIRKLLASVPMINTNSKASFRRIDWDTRAMISAPKDVEKNLVVFARDFPPEGDDCDARLIVDAFKKGWKRFIVYGLKGQRFEGCGLGPDTDDVRIDLYDSPGDYIASGIDGMQIYIHNNAQDQLGQIMKRGRLVIYGDVGQTFMYGAKGGEVYIMGNAAGRPFINAVGKPRVVINGTSLDFLAESFMAGDPHKGGGFVVLNGVEFDDHGKVRELESPYPGSNLFSLASGGAIFVRDPKRQLVEQQLNGGEFVDVDDEDWKLILPMLETNEKLFGVSIEKDLLTVSGKRKSPKEVYRKVRAKKAAMLTKVEIPE